MNIHKLIDHYVDKLVEIDRITPTRLLFEVINDVSDAQLDEWGIDITDVAQLVFHHKVLKEKMESVK